MGDSNKKSIAILLVIIIICAAFTAIAIWKYEEDKETVPDEEEDDGQIPGVDYLTREFIFSEPTFEEHSGYINVYVEESDFNMIGDGRPILPVKLYQIELPFGSEILSVEYEISEPETISLDKKLAFGQYSPRGTLEDEEIYLSSEMYPIDWVTYQLGGGLSEGMRRTFVVIRVYPIRYEPKKDEIKFVDNIKVEVAYKALYKDEPEPESKYDLLIISPSKFVNRLQPLVKHKNNIGVKTTIVKLGDIYDEMSSVGRDKPEQIKYYIKQAIEEWNIKYVLLVGGVDGQSTKWTLPVRNSHVVPYKEQEEPEPYFISDLYYADIYDYSGKFSSWDTNNNDIFAEWTEDGFDEMDLYPDVYLGRLPCRNRIEVKTMVDKIINYEKSTVSEKNWFKKVILIGGDSYNDENNFIEGEMIMDQAAELMPDFDPVKLYASKMKINARVINKNLNNGAGFVYFSGHGTPAQWGTHYPPDGTEWTGMYKNFRMNFLRNKEKLPIVVVGGCFNAKFSVSLLNNLKYGIQEQGFIKYFSKKFWNSGLVTRCWAWKLTSKRGGGAIATIANTGLGTHGREDKDQNGIPDHNEVLDGWMELKFLELYGTEGKDMLGRNHGQTITEYLHRFLGNVDKMDIKMAQQWELFGDPSMKIGGY